MTTLCCLAAAAACLAVGDDSIRRRGIIPADYRMEKQVKHETVVAITNQDVRTDFIIHVGRPFMAADTPKSPDDKWALIAAPSIRNLAKEPVEVRCYVAFYDMAERLLGCFDYARMVNAAGGDMDIPARQGEKLPSGMACAFVPLSVATNVFFYDIRLYTRRMPAETKP